MASGKFDYDQELTFISSIDLEDIGQFAIEANNDDGMFWYLVIRTSMGTCSVATCGPVIPDVELLPSGFTQTLYKMPYREDKLSKTISMFLNDRQKKITKATEIEIDRALNEFRDLSEYLQKYSEELY